MKNLIFVIVSVLPSILFSQEFCGYFLPDINYSGINAPEITIEYFELENQKFLVFLASKEDESVEIEEGTQIEVYFKNRTKKLYSIKDMEVKNIEDNKGEPILGYIHHPSKIEAVQIESGIMALIFIEPFPGDIIRYNFIGNCQ